MSIPPLPQGSVVRASIIHQRESRLHIGSEHAEEDRWSINLRHLLHYLTFLSQMSPPPLFPPLMGFFYCRGNSRRNVCRGYLEEQMATLEVWASWNRALSGKGYATLGATVSHSSRHSVQAVARMALSLTQPYIVPDRATSEIMSAVAHLLLDVFSICWLPQHRGNGCKIYLGQRYYVSNPCSLSQQFRGVWSTFTLFVSIQ